MADHEGKPVLVTGATGRQGGAVLRHLRERGRPVRALTRRPDSPAARALAAQGVEIAAGDMAVVRVALGREFYQMFRWFNTGGFQAAPRCSASSARLPSGRRKTEH